MRVGLEAALDYARSERDRFLGELLDFLRIPSVSALSAHREDLAAAARWVADRLREAGVPHVSILPTRGQPVVLGEWLVDPSRPTVIVYGHYDVQPVDPLDLWESPPFEPEVRDGRIFARGASDDKGGLYVAIKALEAWARTAGAPPLNVKVLVEGEEEVGSPNLQAFLEEHRARLRADLAVSADGGQLGPDRPSLVLGSRGLCACQLEVRGPATDLHSGSFGGLVPNPIHALVELLASMHLPGGAVGIEGFYDEVRPLSPAERAEIARVPFDEEAERARTGVRAWSGESDYSPLERLWARPTLEVNGIWGGFTGEGTKTVIPAVARAKLSCRLVPDQEPQRILDRIEAHVQRHLPPGVTARVTRFPGSARAYAMPHDHPSLAVAGRVLEELYGVEPVKVRMGATVPVAEQFRSVLGIWFLYFAFGEPDNNIHAPNEFFRLDTFQRGIEGYCRLLEALAGVEPAALARAG